ncbi:MAG: hypothetical protein ACREIV_08075, partial [Planctomycetaceae bacterium]
MNTSYPLDDFETAAQPRGRQVDLLRTARQHRGLLFLGAAGGLALGVAAYLLCGPEHVARSRVLVSRNIAVSLSEDGTAAGDFGERGEHIALIMSPMIVGRAVEDGGLDRLPSLAGEEHPVEAIVEDLKVKRSAGQDQSFLNVLDVEYAGRSEADAGAVVAAVIDAYRRYLDETRRQHSEEIVRQITDASARLERELRDKEAEYLRFRAAAPLHWKNP